MAADSDRWSILTAPMYEPTEVARLVRMSVSRVRRWLRGYEYTTPTTRQRKRQGPVVRHDEAGSPYASFLDLIELRFARAFVIDAQLSPQRVRKAFAEARAVTGLDHPFARRRFFTAGDNIYMEVQEKGAIDEAEHLLQLLSGGQWVIAPVVLQYAEQVEFDSESDAVIKWWPLGRQEPVVITPTVAFGEATIQGRGVKTSTLYNLFRAEGDDAGRVAKWMDLSAAEVESAVRFEKHRLMRLAA